MEIEGILYVFHDFHTAQMRQKIRCSAEDDLFRGSLDKVISFIKKTPPGGGGLFAYDEEIMGWLFSK